MHSNSNWQERTMIAGVTALAICAMLVLVSGLNAVHASRPPERGARQLQLSSATIPFKTLSATTPSNVVYTVSSSNGPFCLEGFVINPGLSVPIGPSQIGGVSISLTSIDNNGLSHPSITLVNGATGGITPYDIVLSYGNHICANQQIQFQATQWYGGTSGGISILLSGQAMFLSDRDNSITVE